MAQFRQVYLSMEVNEVSPFCHHGADHLLVTEVACEVEPCHAFVLEGWGVELDQVPPLTQKKVDHASVTLDASVVKGCPTIYKVSSSR